MPNLIMYANRRPRGLGLGDLGQPTVPSILSEARDSYVNTASKLSSVLGQLKDAITSLEKSHSGYVSGVGKAVARVVATYIGSPVAPGGPSTMAGVVGLGAMLPPSDAGAVASSASAAAAAANKAGDVDASVTGVYEKVADTLVNVEALWAMFKDLTLGDLISVAGVTEAGVADLAARAGASPEFAKSTFLWNFLAMVAQREKVDWSTAGNAGLKIMSAINAAEAPVLSLSDSVTTYMKFVPNSAEWVSYKEALKADYKAKFLAAIVDASRKAEKGEAAPGFLRSAYNWIVDHAADIVNVAFGMVFGAVGVFAYIAGFRIIQVDDLSNAAYAAIRLIDEAIKLAGEAAAAAAAEYKKARVDEGRTADEAESRAESAGIQVIETKGPAAFSQANADIQRREDHWQDVEDAWKKFSGTLEELLEKILLYGGLAIGGAIVLWVGVPEIIKKL